MTVKSGVRLVPKTCRAARRGVVLRHALGLGRRIRFLKAATEGFAFGERRDRSPLEWSCGPHNRCQRQSYAREILAYSKISNALISFANAYPYPPEAFVCFYT